MENFDDNNLDNFIIKDKEFYWKRKKKCLLAWIPILLVIIIIIIILVIVLQPKLDNKIICQYKTLKDNENVILINIKNNIDFKIIIDDSSYENNYHIFQRAGTYIIIIEFGDKLDSLEGFFEGINNLVEADFSKLQTNNIKSMANIFKSCSNLAKVYFDNETPNLENLRSMFYNCDSLTTVYLNIDTSKVKQADYMFYNCSKLINIDISNFNLEQLSNSSFMFENCINLEEIRFNNNTLTRNLEDMNSMFRNCNRLKKLLILKYLK